MTDLIPEQLAEIEARWKALTPHAWHLKDADQLLKDVFALLAEIKRLRAEEDAFLADIPVIDLGDPLVRQKFEAWQAEPREPMTPEQIAGLWASDPAYTLTMRDVWRLLDMLEAAEADKARLEKMVDWLGEALEDAHSKLTPTLSPMGWLNAKAWREAAEKAANDET